MCGKVTILNAASFFGRTLPNFVADAYGVFPGRPGFYS